MELSDYSFDAIIFELDGTLTSVSTWLHLAKGKGEENEIRECLAAVEKGKLSWPEAVTQMYDLLQPSYSELLDLAELCLEHLTQDATATLHLLSSLGKKLYLCSFLPLATIERVAKSIGIPHSHLFSWEHPSGCEVESDSFIESRSRQSMEALENFIAQVKQENTRVAFVGNGLTPQSIRQSVQAYIAYGGVYFKKELNELADAYISSTSLSPLLYLLLGEKERAKIGSLGESPLLKKGLDEVKHKRVIINDKVCLSAS